MMSLGIAVNRFAIFLQQSVMLPEPRRRRLFLPETEDLGTWLVIFGIVVMAWAAWRYAVVGRNIDRGSYRPNDAMVYAITGGVLLLGAVSLLWIFRR